MSNLKTTDKKILETLFRMEGGYVLNFSDRTMEQFFKEEFNLDVYGEKSNFVFLGTSKANRMRAVWTKENDKTVGNIILALVECAETELLTSGKEITLSEKELIKKTRDIGTKLLFSELSENFKPDVQDLYYKSELIKDFNSVDLIGLKTNEKIYLLKVFYSYYEIILRTYYGSGLFFLSSGIDDLNDYFKILRKKIIEIINSDKTFSEIKETKGYQGIVEPITSLYSSAEFFDGVWDDFTSPSIIGLREEIADKDLFENNSQAHKVNFVVSSFLEVISREVDTLKKYLEQKTKNFYEADLPKNKEHFNGIFGTHNKQTIKHEHTHHFENSIQEKDIVLNHKYDENKPNTNYIIKKNDDFYYKGRYLKLSKNAEYYQVFCSLFAKLPDGGEITYKELAEEIQSRIPKTKGKTEEEIRKFIQGNLTDRSSGFMRYAEIPDSEDNGKPLIEIIRAKGIAFNNKRG